MIPGTEWRALALAGSDHIRALRTRPTSCASRWWLPGGAAALTDAGVDVHASARTAALMQPSGQGCGVPGDGLPLRWYQHLMWSQAPSCRTVQVLGTDVEFAGASIATCR